MLKRILLVFAMGLFLAAPAMAQQKDKVYINGIDANFPPFAYVGSDGKPTGFDVDAMNWIAEKMGFKITHQPMEWSGIVASLKARKIDMIASGLSVTPARAEQINFSNAYWVTKQVIVVGAKSDLTVEKVLTTGLKIGVQTGTSEGKEMVDANGKDGRKYEVVEYANSALAAQDVLNGRIDAAVMNDAPAASAASKIAVKIIGEAGIPNEEFAVGVAKDDLETMKMVNEGLEMLRADPYWNVLVEKYKPGETQ